MSFSIAGAAVRKYLPIKSVTELGDARVGLLDRSIERALACVVAGVSVLTLGSCGLLMEGGSAFWPDAFSGFDRKSFCCRLSNG